MFQRSIGIILLKRFNLDKVEGISIREQQKLQEQGIDLKNSQKLYNFLKQAVRDGFFMEICTKEIYSLIIGEI